MSRLYKKGDEVFVYGGKIVYVVVRDQVNDQAIVWCKMKTIENMKAIGNYFCESGFHQSNVTLFKAVDDPKPNHVVDAKPDTVNSPAHYNQGEIECIDAIEAALTEEEFRGFCKGNALKYIWRERKKGCYESILKASWYLDRLKGGS